MIVETGDHRVPFGGLAEAGGEGQMRFRIEVLAGEEHHLALQPDLADGGHGVVVEVAQVDAAYLGTDGG